MQVSETATVLSVRDHAADGRHVDQQRNAVVAVHLSATISGPDAGLALKGTLVLKGERNDDGSTEVEGRLLPDAALRATPTVSDSASAPTSIDLQAQLDAQRAALKSALRADIDALSATLKLALADGAVAGAKEPSAAQQEAMAAFKVAFDQRLAQYRAALSALSADGTVATSSGTQTAKPRATAIAKVPGAMKSKARSMRRASST